MMRSVVFVIGVVAGALGNDEQVEMILKVASHSRQIEQHRDAHGAQMVRRPDSRLHQQLGRTDRARGNDDFAIGANETSAARSGDLDAAGSTLFFFFNDKATTE